MAKFGIGIIACSALLSLCAQGQERPSAQTTTAGEGARLPVQRVVLYKSGVGYFEHLGHVRNNDQVAVSFTSGQLDDVLKSLTVLDLDGGRIAGVEYGSAAPMDRQLGDLRLPIGEKSSLTEILGTLRGARLEIRSGTAVITGRLLSIERKTRISGGTTLEVDYLSLITDAGELRTTELAPSFSVRLLDPDLAGKVGRYLDVVSAARDADTRVMQISAGGSGERRLFVSYISEVPVWKTTYRVVVGSKGGQKPLLQGWAIVDNTTAQDWSGVQLSLVAGAPQSFVQNLSQPYYSRRPVVPLPTNVSASPQTYEATLIAGNARVAGRITDQTGAGVAGAAVRAYSHDGALLAEATADGAGDYRLTSIPDGRVRLEVEASGFNRVTIPDVAVSGTRPSRLDAQLQVGNMTQSVEVTAAPAPAGVQTSMASVSRIPTGGSLGSGATLGGGGMNKKGPPPPPPSLALQASTARAQAESAAVAQELGDLFEYKLKQAVTIQRNRSALLPVVQAPVEAEKVSVWNERAGLNRPLRALWLTNSSGLTLDGGSFSVMEDETFEGEGVMEQIRPGEKRLISYATDLAVNASSRDHSEQERVTRVRVNLGTMTQDSEVRERKTYTFRNEDTSPRTLIVEHPVRLGYELRSQPQPEELTATWMRFRLKVEAKQSASLVVEETRPLQSTFLITNVTANQVDLFVSQRSVDKPLEEALRRIVAQKAVIAAIESRSSTADDEGEKIFDDQQRLRENIKALKGTAEEKALLQRYVQSLNQEESRIESLRKQGEDLEKQADNAKEVLNRMIQELSFDVKL